MLNRTKFKANLETKVSKSQWEPTARPSVQHKISAAKKIRFWLNFGKGCMWALCSSTFKIKLASKQMLWPVIGPRRSGIICEGCLLVSLTFRLCFDSLSTMRTIHTTLMSCLQAFCLTLLIPYIHKKREQHLPLIKRNILHILKDSTVCTLLQHDFWSCEMQSCSSSVSQVNRYQLTGWRFKGCDPSFHTEFSA